MYLGLATSLAIILISAAFIVRPLLEGRAYFRPGANYRKYGNQQKILQTMSNKKNILAVCTRESFIIV